MNNLVYFEGYSGWSMIVIVSWAIENNLVYFWDYSGWVYDCDSFLVISTGWLVIMIVSWPVWK